MAGKSWPRKTLEIASFPAELVGQFRGTRVESRCHTVAHLGELGVISTYLPGRAKSFTVYEEAIADLKRCLFEAEKYTKR